MSDDTQPAEKPKKAKAATASPASSSTVRVKAKDQKVHISHAQQIKPGEEADVPADVAAILKERGLVE